MLTSGGCLYFNFIAFGFVFITACCDVSPLGIKSTPPAVEAWILNPGSPETSLIISNVIVMF